MRAGHPLAMAGRPRPCDRNRRFLDNFSLETYIGPMARDHREWLMQAEYDLDTAKFMHSGGRFFYAVFMCHLAVEKALKGLYQKKYRKIPEKSHNLVFFLDKLETAPPETIGKFIVKLNSASVATRYPESLAEISGNYTGEIAQGIIDESQEALEWAKRQY
jgi:HEPN domain-containing protein